MNHGCSTRIPGPNGKLLNATRQNSPRPKKKARLSRSRVKTIIIVFFFSTAVVLCTDNLYLQDRQLITPSTKMSWKEFENGSRGGGPNGHCRRLGGLHHDKAPAHTALSIREILAKKKYSRTSTSSLQPRSSSVRFIPLR